jgi:tetratricopeptide (TPR) repeat protein
MAPLCAAVVHGCQAGKHQDALYEVFWKRIRRGNEAFSLKKLGAFGADLAALSGFFDPPWSKPVDGLSESLKGFILSEAGFDLRALGRLAEAAQPMKAGLEAPIAQQNWTTAAASASNLSELYLTLGDLAQALGYAEQSVELAGRSGDAFWRMVSRITLSDVLHQAGRLTEAAAAFRGAEERQKERQPGFPLLYSVQGYRYCDLLLSQGDYADVGRRARQTLEWAKRQSIAGLLTLALDNLSLGRAHLLHAQREPNYPITNSLEFLDRAVDGLRQAGTQHHIPRGLLARAEYYRLTGAFERARRDLDEAFTIATRGGMGLHLADCHLEYARLYLAILRPERSAEGTQSKDMRAMTEEQLKEKAQDHWGTAKDMIEKTGYHRRDREVQELEEQLHD